MHTSPDRAVRYPQAKFFKGFRRVKGVIGVRLEVAQFDFDIVLGFVQVRATKGRRSAVSLRNVLLRILLGSTCKKPG